MKRILLILTLGAALVSCKKEIIQPTTTLPTNIRTLYVEASNNEYFVTINEKEIHISDWGSNPSPSTINTIVNIGDTLSVHKTNTEITLNVWIDGELQTLDQSLGLLPITAEGFFIVK